MSGIAHPKRSANSMQLLGSMGANISAGLCTFIVVLYQCWFMPYFLPFFTGRDEFARLVFHALYGGVLTIALTVLAMRADVRRAIFPLAIAAILAVVPVALHPVEIVAKCYLITLFLGGAGIVFMLASNAAMALRVSACVTALGALTCFLDLLFGNGFTNTPGRAAGLAINPNVAAAGLLLGAAASYRSVSQKWRASFLVLVGAAMLATLSRSTLLAALGSAVAPLVVQLWQQYRRDRRFHINLQGWGRAGIVAFALLGVIGVALATNAYFRLAIDESFAGVLSLSRALDEASEAVDAADGPPPSGEVAAAATEDVLTQQPAPSGPSMSADTKLAPGKPATGSASDRNADQPADAVAAFSWGSPSTPEVSPTRSVNKMQALDQRLTDEGIRNSISARALFLQRGMLAYREGGFFGRGLKEAQDLAPHNTFLLFAIAFGHLGWLVPIALVGFTFCFARSAGDLGLGISVTGVMLTSHDVLLTPSLFLPVALGIGGMIAERKGTTRQSPPTGEGAPWGFAFGTAAGVGMFVAGCIAILLVTPPLSTGRLQGQATFTARGAYETLLPRSQFPGLFRFNTIAGISPSQVSYMSEDSKPLRRVNWTPHAWPAVGPGQYTFRRRDAVLFATTDSSDPRRNDRDYEITVPTSVSVLCFALMGMIIAWSIATMAAVLTPTDRSRVSG
ncbi:hypothetical protein LB565_28620 [Mesorhizobium sp. CA14]|uniref:hypothetical protein n=1 Tax=Mesorhizobium sp. CA14 TaxID=2876642 RepID=UPI001CCC89DE|nr:hypothetical protein [Mesorhizobium sp. CA14]MBZ9851951.1 hypothetical protein [Mesorhizobium sp. CA14]